MYESIAMLIISIVSFMIAFVCYVKLCFAQGENKDLSERNIRLNQMLNENHLRTIILEEKQVKHLELISKLRSQAFALSKEIEDLSANNVLLKSEIEEGKEVANELIDKIDELVQGA